VAHLVKKIQDFEENKSFITVLIQAAVGSYPEPDESIPHIPNLLNYIFRSPKWYIPSDSPTAFYPFLTAICMLRTFPI
jgi:hypothetical protein